MALLPMISGLWAGLSSARTKKLDLSIGKNVEVDHESEGLLRKLKGSYEFTQYDLCLYCSRLKRQSD